MEREKIMKRLAEHKLAVEKLGYKVIYIALCGSQNYGLDTPQSDIDTKAIVIPSFEHFVKNTSPVSFTHIMENEEHCDVKQVSEMFDCFKKQNINYLEILFTEYQWTDIEYKGLLKPLFDAKEQVAHLDRSRAVNCMAGMAMEKYKALEHPYPTIKWKIDKWGYDGKQLHHIIRMMVFLDRYITGYDFEKCLVDIGAAMRASMMKAKANEYSLEEARHIAQMFMGTIKDLRQEALDTGYTERPRDEGTLKLLDNVLVEVMKLGFKQELGLCR